ncbi:MAG: ABC transporter permease, partial [Paracoccaceae bacterium]|nr:ABC transporter permease [Paracoccaceae bacterium]
MILLNYVVLPLAVILGLAYGMRMIVSRWGPGQVGVLFRSMPLTGAFGLTVILLYIVGAVFAPLIAPYG